MTAVAMTAVAMTAAAMIAVMTAVRIVVMTAVRTVVRTAVMIAVRSAVMTAVTKPTAAKTTPPPPPPPAGLMLVVIVIPQTIRLGQASRRVNGLPRPVGSPAGAVTTEPPLRAISRQQRLGQNQRPRGRGLSATMGSTQCKESG